MSIFQKIMQNDNFFLGILGRKFLQKSDLYIKGRICKLYVLLVILDVKEDQEENKRTAPKYKTNF